MAEQFMVIFRFRGPAVTLMVKNEVNFSEFKAQLANVGVPSEFITVDMISKTEKHDECALKCEDQWNMLKFLLRNSGLLVVTITTINFIALEHTPTAARVTYSAPQNAAMLPTNSHTGAIQIRPDLNVVPISDDNNVPHIDLPITEKKVLLTAPWANYIERKGQVFKGGVTQFRMKLSKYMLEKGYKFNYVRNTKQQVLVRCAHLETHSCTWSINATASKYNKWFHIRSFQPEHCCPMEVRKNKRLSAKIIGALIVDKVKNNPNITANEIMDLFKDEYSLNVDYMPAYRGLEQAQQFIYGCHDDSYHELKWYILNLLKVNVGSRVEFIEGPVTNKATGETKYQFLRTFVAFGATIKGFEHCRPMLFIDGTHLSGRYAGVLLTATAKDGDNGLFPVAFAVVESEDKDNWRWFLLNLITTFSAGRKVIFVSYRHKGLMALFEHEFKDYENFYCLQHLQRNLRDKLKKRALSPAEKDHIVSLFSEAARAPTLKIYNEKIEELKIEGDATAVKFLGSLTLKKWAFAHAPCVRFGEMTSNAAESYNNQIKDARELPITQCVDAIRTITMEQMYRRRTAAETWAKGLCAGKLKDWNLALQESRSWNIRRATKYVFEFLLGPTLVVKLDERKCDCYGWQFHGYPCVHGIAAIHLSGEELDKYIDPYYFANAYKLAYSGAIMPVATILKLTEAVGDWQKVFPPIKRRSPGRPNKKRILSIGEHGSRKKRSYRCTACKMYGHGKKDCKGIIAPDWMLLKFVTTPGLEFTHFFSLSSSLNLL